MNPIKRFFQEDIPATFSAGKWRIDLMQYKTRLSGLEKQRNSFLAELGRKAWDNKVQNEKYAAIFSRLEEQEGLAVQAQEEIDAVQNKINLETSDLNTTNADFDTKIKEAQSKRQRILEKLAGIQVVQKDIERRIAQLQSMANQYAANLQSLNNQVNQVLSSEQVDKEAKIASIKDTIASVQAQKEEAQIQINAARAELEANQTEQQPVKSEADGLNQLIVTLQQQNKDALIPIQERLKLLRQDLLKANEKKAKIIQQLTALMPEFGGQVYKFRPLSDALTADYDKVDQIEKEIKTLSDQVNLTEARLATLSSGSLIKVAVTGGALVFMVVALVVFVTWGIPFVAKLLTPDPKASVKLMQDWTLENCAPSGGADDIYYHVSVWENRHSSKPVTVTIVTKLLGANDVVLSSNDNSLTIAPGGAVVKIEALDSNGSRVQRVTSSVEFATFMESSLQGQIKDLDVQLYFEKAAYSDNVSLALEIINKSDFSVSSSGDIFALVVNGQNQIIDILAGDISERTIKIDSLSKVTFQSINRFNLLSCLQDDYTEEEVTFWYFVPLEVSTDFYDEYMIFGKAVRKP